MVNTHLHIIHLEKRQERLFNLMKEFEQQGITQYSILEGIIDLAAVFRGISNAHKRCVMLAKQQGYDNIIIGEDDLTFTSLGGWQYFLDNMPDKYSMYFASYYEGKVDENNRLVKSDKADEMLSGLTLYSIHSSFYDTFLNINDMDHLDKQISLLSDQYEFYVAPEFCAIQMNGYSDNKKMDCNYDRYMVGRKLFGINS